MKFGNNPTPWVISLILFLGSCSKPLEYPQIIGQGRCGNGIQDRGEIGIDCGGDCPNSCDNVRYLEGEIFRRTPLNPNYEYVVTGPLIIREKASLDIPAGTRLKVKADVGAYIAVMQGGSIFAWGRADKPITITSNASEPLPGDWGGLIICGKAPIPGEEKQLSSLGYYYYGGDRFFDSSGYLKYVKIEYAGAAYDSLQNFNAISFYGTGMYTVVDHIWIDKSLDTGIEINGGAMALEDLFIREGNVGVRIQEKWSGKGENWFFDATTYSGISFYNSSKTYSNTPSTTYLNNITINHPGVFGISFNGDPEPLQLRNVLFESAAVGIGFTDLSDETPLLYPIQLKNIHFRNSPQKSNLPSFFSLLDSATTVTPTALDQTPQWIINWPMD
ncbi:MAG: hypothetical protein ACON47_04630 [Flavobacteriaceae bacterium]